MIPRCNLHTHTVFCDGKNTPEEMVLSAIEQGCCTLGFSGHTPIEAPGDTDWCMTEENVPIYGNEILALKKKYSSQIEILLGLEVDSESPPSTLKCDYKIGSVHYVRRDGVWIPVDASYELLREQIKTVYRDDMMAYLRDYFSSVATVVEKTGCDIVGHFDLNTKYNEKHPHIDEEDSRYRSMALEALDAVMEHDVFIEINTGAISRGYRTTPYPAPFLLRRIAEKAGRLILNGDSHRASDLFSGYETAIDIARSVGVRELWIYRDQKFQPISI